MSEKVRKSHKVIYKHTKYILENIISMKLLFGKVRGLQLPEMPKYLKFGTSMRMKTLIKSKVKSLQSGNFSRFLSKYVLAL